MNSEQFVEAIKLYVRDSAVRDTVDTLSKPPGRKPSPRLVNQSKWYNNLSESDKSMVGEVIEEAIDAALFGMLAALDSVRAIDDRKGTFQLFYVGQEKTVLLNDMEEESLHDIYNHLTLTE